ncbi:amidohydrolase [Microbacterium sp. NPDC058345]|uniref:amidohydrolase n=1 Tax=Microbacterium sp. NPDC058345 TaxID=3346455 RepID=UPI003658653C
MTDVYLGGNVFTATSRRWATALVVQDGTLVYVGDDDTARRLAGTDATVTDLGGATVLPGFVDGHAHVINTGESAQHVDLWGASSLDDIQRAIAAFAAAHPELPRIRAHGWRHDVVGGQPTRQMLDAAVPDRPVYAQAFDFHSVWLNSAALAEVGIDSDTVSPPGGAVHTDAAGDPTGYIDEIAMHRLVYPVLDGFVTADNRDRALREALAGYRASGVTAATDMSLDGVDLAAFARAESAGELTARVSAYWFVAPTGDVEQNLAQVREAARHAQQHASDRLRVVGIKVMIDGTIDGCTAAVSRPYVTGVGADPIWSLDELAPVVTEADALGIRVAMHAIGDEAVRIAVGAVERAIATNGPRERRHRIEHLEIAEQADVERLAALGIVASMQPVHCDPAIQENWRAMLGDDRVERGYPWPYVTQAGGRLAFGTDSPTSPHPPLRNMFIAATRRSAIDPTLPANIPAFALPLADAIEHATRDAAWACGAEHLYGTLEAGRSADFVVLDRDVFARPVDELLATTVVRTVVGGVTVHEEQRG